MDSGPIIQNHWDPNYDFSASSLLGVSERNLLVFHQHRSLMIIKCTAIAKLLTTLLVVKLRTEFMLNTLTCNTLSELTRSSHQGEVDQTEVCQLQRRSRWQHDHHRRFFSITFQASTDITYIPILADIFLLTDSYSKLLILLISSWANVFNTRIHW